MEFCIGLLSILVLILLVVLCNRPVKTQIVYETVKEKINEIVNMPTYTAQAISDAYAKRVYSEDAVIEKLTTALLHKINTHPSPPKFIDLNDVVRSFRRNGVEIFNTREVLILRKDSTHQKLRDLGYKITVIPQEMLDIDDFPPDDIIKLEWN